MNAIKYAHPSGIPVRIEIACSRKADGGLLLTISDDGVGLPEGFDAEQDGGMGFKMIRTLAGSLKAGLEIQSTSLGLSLCLDVPPV